MIRVVSSQLAEIGESYGCNNGSLLSNYGDYYDEWDNSDTTPCKACRGTGLDKWEEFDCEICGGEGVIVRFDRAVVLGLTAFKNNNDGGRMQIRFTSTADDSEEFFESIEDLENDLHNTATDEYRESVVSQLRNGDKVVTIINGTAVDTYEVTED